MKKSLKKKFSGFQKMLIMSLVAVGIVSGAYYIYSNASTIFDVTLRSNLNLEEGLTAHYTFDGDTLASASSTYLLFNAESGSALATTSGHVVQLSYDGAQALISSLVYDPTEGVLYAGQRGGAGDGDIYYCKPSAGDADGLCEDGEWTLAYNGSRYNIYALVYDSIEGVLYAGQELIAGDGDIYYCKPSAGDADGLCEDGEWTLAYDGAQDGIYALVHDSTEGVLYAGQGSDLGDGDIYYCKPSAGDADGLCESGEWTLAYDGAQEGIYSLVYDPTEAVLYAGQGSGTGDGDIYYCKPSAGDADGLCESGEWTLAYSGSQEGIFALVYDATEGALYAGQGSGTGDGDIYYCKPSAGDADGLCESGEWTLAYNGAQEGIYALVYDPTEAVLYAGQGSGTGDGDIYYCKPSAGDADGLCETGEWTLAYNGAQEYISSLVYDATEGALYAGQGSGTGDGDIFVMRRNSSVTVPGILGQGVSTELPGAASTLSIHANTGSTTVASLAFWVDPRSNSANDTLLRLGDWETNFYSAGSSLGLMPSLRHEFSVGAAQVHHGNTLLYDSGNGVLYAGQLNSTGDGDIYYCKPSAGDADGLCEDGEWTLSYNGAQEGIYSLVYDPTEAVLYAGQGSGTGDGDIYYCKPSAGDADGLCESGEWTLAYSGSQEGIFALVYDSTEEVLYAGQGYSFAGDGDIYYCKPSAGDADGLCESGEWTLAYNGAQEGIYALVYDSTEEVLYAGQGSNSGDGDIYYCKPSAGDADGLCEDGEWTLTYGGAQEVIYALVYDPTEGVLYAGQGSSAGDGDIYYCKPSAGDADGLCESGEWTLAYGGSEDAIHALLYEPTEEVLYAGQGDSTGDGDIYYCKPSAGDADGLCESGEWNVLFVGSQLRTRVTSLWVDPVSAYVYAPNLLIVPATLYIDGQVGTVINSYNEWHHVAIDLTHAAESAETLEIIAPETAIDDIRVYSQTLGAENVSRLYGLAATARIGKTLTANPQLEDGLTHHWTFDATGATSTFSDRVGGLTGDVVATTTYEYHSTTTSPTTLVGDDAYGVCNVSVSLNWSTPSNAASQSDTYAIASHTTFDSGAYSGGLKSTGYGFTVPTDRVTIDGVAVEMDRYTSASTAEDGGVYIVTGDTTRITVNRAVSGNWATSDTDTYVTRGSSTDLWSQTLTPSVVNNSGFGWTVCAKSTGANTAARIDHVRMTVYYTQITYQKIPVAVPGAIGQGFHLHGEGDHLDFGDAGSGVKTLAFWVKFPGSRASQKILNIDGTDVIETNSSGQIVATSFPSATVYVDGSSASAAITDTDWHHVVVTDTTGVNASTLKAGHFGIPNYGTFSIDDVRTYDRVISEDDIKRLYGLGNTTRIGKTLANPALDSGLVGHWSFDGKDIDLSQVTAEVRDRSGQGFHGDWRNHATTTVPGALGQAIYFDGVDDYVYIGDAYNGVKSVGLWFYTNATGTQLIEFNATQAIEIGESTVTTHSITSPTVYVDGVKDGTFGVNGWHHVVVTTNTGIDASVVQIPEPGDGAGTADTGWVTAGSGSSVAFSGADQPWSTPGNITADDATYTSTAEDMPVGQESYYLRAYNFGLAVPAGSTINGVEARFEGYETNATDNQLINHIRLVNASGAVTTTDKATSAELSTTPTLYAFGGASDVWGETLDTTYVNDTDFGFVFSTLTGTGGDARPYVDYMQVKVTYTEPSSKFSGAFDDFRMYNRALSADEAKRLYEMGR